MGMIITFTYDFIHRLLSPKKGVIIPNKTVQSLIKTNIEYREENFFTKTPYIYFHPISFIILIINLLFYLLEHLLYYLSKHQNFNCTLYYLGAQYTPAIIHDYHLWRLFTPIVLHSSMIHFLMNSLSIFNIGFRLENFIGQRRYLIVYVVSGVYSNAMSAVVNVESIGIGASGSIMGLCGFLSGYFIRDYGKMVSKERRAVVIFFGMIVLNLVAFGVVIDMMGIGKVDNAAHLGGYVTGIIMYVMMIDYNKKEKTLLRILRIIAKSAIILMPLCSMVLLYSMKSQVSYNDMSYTCL